MNVLMRTPAPHPEESARSYLTRLSEANGYTDTSIITSLAGEQSTEYVVTVGWDYTKLKTVVGNHMRLPENFGYRTKGRKTRESVLLGRNLIHPRHLGLQKARICPDCISEFGYAPMAWDLKAFVACPMHGRMMLKRCPVCHSRIKYNRPGLLICRCGADLSTADAVAAPPGLLGLMEILWAKVHCDHSILNQAANSGFPVRQLLCMDLDVLCRTIVVLAGTVMRTVDGRRMAQRSAREVSEYIPEVSELFAHWPMNFMRFCQKFHRTALRPAGPDGVFQQAFSWLFVRLHKNLRSKGSQTLYLLEPALQYGMRNWDRRPIRLREKALRNLNLPKQRYGSYSDAANVLRWTTWTTLRWLRSGRLPAVALGKKTARPNWRVDLERLACMKFSVHPGLGVRPAAREIGLPYSVYKVLLARGRIPREHETELRRTAAVEDLHAFRIVLLKHADPVVPMAACFMLGDVLDGQLAIEKKADLIEGIADGRIPTFGDCESIRDLCLDSDVIAGHRPLVKNCRARMTIREAMHRYDLGFYEARAIFIHQTGRRFRSDVGVKKFAPVMAIEAFLKEYVPLRTIAKIEGVYSISLRQALERSSPKNVVRLSAGCGPASRQLTIYGAFIRRKGIRQAIQIARNLKRRAQAVKSVSRSR